MLPEVHVRVAIWITVSRQPFGVDMRGEGTSVITMNEDEAID